MQVFLNKKFHFVGIGGCGMSAIAVFLKNYGAIVTGSDKCESNFSRQLTDIGIPVFIGHKESNVPECDYIVKSSAIKNNNCEILKSQSMGIKTFIRGEMLGEILSDKKVIAVAGSHGKTSTVAMLSWFLHVGGFDANTVVGGMMNNFNSNFLLKNSEWFVTEADESDNTMNCLNPQLLVLLNIDDDHIDHYGSQEKMIAEYIKLARKTGKHIVLNAADKTLSPIATSVPGKVIYYGNESGFHVPENSIEYQNHGTFFKVKYKNEFEEDFYIPIPGKVFLNNFLASITVAFHLGVPISKIKEAATTFSGVKRRTEDWGTVNGIKIIEDYAHHPTEISVMLDSISKWHKGRTICIFQPHRYTRSKHIANLLAESFAKCDTLILTDIYSADEPPIEGITGKFVADEITKKRISGFLYIKELSGIIPYLMENTNNNDVVIFMGAGNVGALAREFRDTLLKQQVSSELTG